MAISYVGGTQGNGGDVAWSLSLAGLGLQEGDIVVFDHAYWGSDGTTKLNSSGWTTIADQFQTDTSPVNNYGYYKIMGSTPDTQIDFLASGSSSRRVSAVAHAWRGVNVTTPMDVTPTVATGASTSYITAPAITPTTSGAVVLIAGGSSGPSDVLTSVTVPSGYSNALLESSETGSNPSSNAVIASKAWTSGTETPAQWVLSNTGITFAFAAWTIALRPIVILDFTHTDTLGLTEIVETSRTINSTNTDTISLSEVLTSTITTPIWTSESKQTDEWTDTNKPTTEFTKQSKTSKTWTDESK